jgi:hypothetical protein
MRMGNSGGSATFSRQDLWKSDLSRFQNVVIFGVGEMVRKWLCDIMIDIYS